jgi:Tol biopolymer transport system component
MSRDLRDRLRHVADHAPQSLRMPARMEHRVHVRETRNAVASAIVGITLVILAVTGARAILPSQGTTLPAIEPTPTVAPGPVPTQDRITVMTSDGPIDVDPTGIAEPQAVPSRGFAYGWSPDGTRLLTQSGNDLFVEESGGASVRVTDGDWQSGGGGSWSPDGSKIVYADRSGNRWLLRVANTDGSGNPSTVFKSPPGVTLAFPAWSPDGRTIAVLRDSHPWLIDADGTNFRSAVSDARMTASSGQMSWSPDSSELLIPAQVTGEWPSIYAIDVARGAATRLMPDASHESVGPFSPCWSRDGSRIYFAWGRPDGLSLFVMNADGSDIQGLDVEVFKDTSVLWHEGVSQ